ncbi:MAG: hypothetical protein ACR2MD_07565 [Aridibacter sp.]
MEYTYIDRASETGFVKTALMTVLAVSLVPSSNHFIPQQTSINYGEHAETNTQAVVESNSQISENEQAEILLSFANKLAKKTKDLDNDIAQIISDDFWEMYD